ncbi:SWIM zinc finger family protein [Nocardia sp. alder85J]|uniref:SWIM zinc finger family protein n=1 Tax=Nocardia sp. alder85J TaxID=2862949 RepID=UPI001CD54038|nr:SWIM zinc finger family protein [Nocardia sp. alder85J]MCX4092117.1 SWIM zinc finger family protein [Nocardia sp. alder85J]
MTTTATGVDTMSWTADRIAALAPDAASLSAARGLRGRWSGTGRHRAALWGLCAGSGATPYRTVVDLDGPAYTCTCPSRKFPCKHALALLLVWSEGAVAEAEAPADFAATWLTARAARAAKPVAAVDRAPDPGTGGQRRARVAAGLADLEVWLCDQIRTGLAQSDRSFPAFEAVAARMVDAQAPGVAAALRQLPRVALVREDWPVVLLREFGRLHLLAAAHRRLDELAPGPAASVRTHIGYPVTAESVRAQPPVRDRWMVLGQRHTEEERLHTRRVWLRGRTSGRWALIVDHSFGSPAFPPDMPLPGTMIDADLHFHPAAAPLRAVWGVRHDVPEPFTTVPVAPAESAAGERLSGIATALREHAAALGADPWLRGWPVLLPQVVPVVTETDWYVRESDGSALRLARCAEAPWSLLGVSGGHPVTVIGEWTADGLVPISVFTAGDIAGIVADPVSGAPGDTAADPMSTALLGTARRGVRTADLPGPVAAAAQHLSGDPAAVLLDIAVLYDLFTRAAILPDSVPAPEPAADDERPVLSQAAAARLAGLLTGGSPFLPEWFEAAERPAFRAPDALSCLVLEQARTRTELRESLLRLASVRGAWLARHNPAWRNLVRDAATADDIWSHGRAAERRAWLAALRTRDPQRARETLAASWSREPGPARAELLAVLGEGLTLADESLLESALDDSRAEVRLIAADLLARLPDSAFGGRMELRAAQWVRLSHGRLLARLPPEPDASARRDGLAARPAGTGYRLGGPQDLRAERLHRLVAATPLRYWESLSVTPATVIDVEFDEGMLEPWFAGLAEAALAQRDLRWATALFELFGKAPALGPTVEVRRELFALLPATDRLRQLRALDSSWLAELELLVPTMPRPWPLPLAEHVLRLLLDRAHLAAARPGAPGLSPVSYRSLFHAAAVNFPTEASAAASGAGRRSGDPQWEHAFDQLVHDLTLRKTMLEELR